MDTFEAFGQDSSHAQQRGAFRRPVTRRPRTVLLAGEHDERRALFGITHGCVVDRGHLPAGEESGEPALRPRRQLVAEPNVGERASHHHLVVAATGPVGVEIDRSHTVFYKPRTCRAVFSNVPGG